LGVALVAQGLGVGGDAFSEGGNAVLRLFLVLCGVPTPFGEGREPRPGPDVVKDGPVAEGGGLQA
jgi:hypothetical protein